jgi:hypothetical protein
MQSGTAEESSRQYSLGYLLSEIGLIAIALAASRLALVPHAVWLEGQAGLLCIALVAGCGAVGGLGLRMAVGLIGGGIFAVASIPLVWMLISAA